MPRDRAEIVPRRRALEDPSQRPKPEQPATEAPDAEETPEPRGGPAYAGVEMSTSIVVRMHKSMRVGMGAGGHAHDAHQTDRIATNELDHQQPGQLVDRHVDQVEILTCKHHDMTFLLFALVLHTAETVRVPSNLPIRCT